MSKKFPKFNFLDFFVVKIDKQFFKKKKNLKNNDLFQKISDWVHVKKVGGRDFTSPVESVEMDFNPVVNI